MRFRGQRPSSLLPVGLMFLAFANIGQWYLQRHTQYPENVVDFTSGLMQGIAIGTTLLGLWLTLRARRGR